MLTDKLTLNIELYKKLFLVRKTEEYVIQNYSSDDMKTPMHMSMGSEAIAVGVCQALGKKHQALGTYRSHGLYLAKTEDTEGFFAEMYGKSTGAVKGIGGSMHLLSPQNGLLGVSAIVASTIPVAIGAAFANKYQKEDKIVAVFFGDGAVDEGVFWESLNVACLFKLPVIFVCEDNNLAVHTSTNLRRGYKDLTKIVSQFNCQVLKENSTDVESIYKITNKAIGIVNKNQKPVFLQLKYYRYLEHVGVNEDFNAGYRKKSEFMKWFKKDPLALQRTKLLKMKLKEEEIQKIEQRLIKKIEASLEAAQKAPFPTKNALFQNVYYED